MNQRLSKFTGGYAAYPLAILFGLNFVDEFDRVAFAALISELRDAFDLSDAGIQAVAGFAGLATLILALPMGVLGDRFNRVRLSVIAAALWGGCAVLTGLVPTVWLLFIVRLGTGLGRIINEVVHPSLLSDYYPREAHPKVFGAHRVANSAGALAGPIAGIIAANFSWEVAFIVLALPTGALLAAALKLREPIRGESQDKDLAEALADEGAVPFGEAYRQLAATRTLKRFWAGAFLLGIGAFQIGNIVSLFFEDVYGFGPVGRGFVQFVFGAGNVVGLVIGARLATKASENGEVSKLASITGLSFVQFALGCVLLAVSPWAVVGVAMAFFLSIGIGSYQPAYFSILGAVAPARVRSQSYAYGILWYGGGGLFYTVLLAGIGENSSYRLLLTILAIIVAVAGLIGNSARGFVKRDMEQAASTLQTAVQIREELAKAGSGPLLVCRNVEVAYDQVQILFGVNMQVERGEIVALLGTNGAGKSTLLKAISGLVDPIGGAIFFDGRDITHADGVQTTSLGAIQVPGGKAVFPTLTVAEHLRAAGWLYKDDQEYLKQANEEVLEIFPRLRERIDQMAGNLSGGEQQMLALGMAFIAKPKLLMIDELSLGLAPTIVEQLLGIVRRIRDNGTAIIVVEQSINVALTIAERAYFLEKGEVRFEGPTAELLERDDIVRSVFLEGAASDGKGGTQKAKTELRVKEDPRVIAERPVVLDLNGVTKRFGGIRAVDDATFLLREGEILGLIGPNGAGKTTVFDLISGFLIPDGGRIEFMGRDVTTMSADKRAWLGLGRSFQDARLVPSLTVAENMALGLERHIELRDHMAALLNLPLIRRQEEDVAWSVEDLIELMNLGAFRDKFVRELSTGSRRIVDLAMCIAHDPNVLLLDEPASGIAQKETEALGPLLERIQRETGCALLIIEHDMPLITAVSDRMIALELGHPIAEGTPEEVIADPRVVSSYLGGDISAINRSGGPTREPAGAGSKS
jgi:ABC-type branched-subunit amino acid transport system ATPase component/predicted MFS family arabinose efflux permease